MRKPFTQSINFKKLRFIEAKENYSLLFFENNENKYISKTLKTISSHISQSSFCRCHRSYIVNMKYATTIDFSRNIIQLDKGEEVPISRRNKSVVRKVIKGIGRQKLKYINRY